MVSLGKTLKSMVAGLLFIAALGNEAMAQVVEAAVSRNIVQQYISSLYPREGTILLWRTPILYSLIGLEGKPDASLAIEAALQEFGSLAGVRISPASHPGESGLNLVLIFSDNPESLSTDPGLQSLFIGSGQSREYTPAELSAFQASLKNLEAGGSMTRYFLSDSDIVFFAAVTHAKILKQGSNQAVRRLLFSAVIHAEGAPPESVDSILSINRVSDRLSLLDEALVRHLYSIQSPTRASVLRGLTKDDTKGGQQ